MFTNRTKGAFQGYLLTTGVLALGLFGCLLSTNPEKPCEGCENHIALLLLMSLYRTAKWGVIGLPVGAIIGGREKFDFAEQK